MSTITLRSTKGSPLTNTEVDNNFSNLNTDKLEFGGTYSAGTANGVAYLNGSKVLTSGSALTFNGTNLGIGTSSPTNVKLQINSNSATAGTGSLGFGGVSSPLFVWRFDGTGDKLHLDKTYASVWSTPLTIDRQSGNVGIGTSSPTQRIDASMLNSGASGTVAVFRNAGTSTVNTAARIVLTSRSGDEIRGSYIEAINVGGSNYPFDLVFGTSSSNSAPNEKMRLDNAGNLGLGVTPSAWDSGKAFEIGNTGNGLWGVSSSDFRMTQNAYYSSGQNRYASTNPASLYIQGSGTHKWYTAPSGTAGNAISFTQAMTLDASGNVGIGTSSPSQALDVTGSINVSSDLLYGRSLKASSVLGDGSASAPSICVGYDYDNGFFRPATNTIGFTTGGTERARIDSSGNLLVGTTSTQSAGFLGIVLNGSAGAIHTGKDSTDGRTHFGFWNPNGQVGSITTTGSATTYGTSSDYRLKDNIQDITGSGAFIDALQPRSWNWKVDGSVGAGFIAHELQAVSPSSVVGEKDAVDAEGNPEYQAVEYGSAEVIAMLVAEVKSLRARLNAAGL